MTPKQAERRKKIFKDLTKGWISLSEILKQPNQSDPEEQEYYKKRDELFVELDSRFSSVWFRILAHVASDQACKKNFRSDYKFISEVESAMEEWEGYYADLIMTAEIGEEAVEKTYSEGKAFCLF